MRTKTTDAESNGEMKDLTALFLMTDGLVGVLREGALQFLEVDAFIGGLLGGQGGRGGEQLSADHVVERAIDGIDGHEPVFTKIKNGKFATFEIAAGHDLVVALGDSGHLEFDVELVGPKPRQSSIGIAAACYCDGDTLSLVGGVLDGL